jgi:hypothetical protein
MKGLLTLLLMAPFLSIAQEQLAVRVNESGLMKVMQMALKYNTGTHSSRSVVIPQNLYQFTVKQKDLAANPIVSILGEISDINLNKDLDFYLKTSDIKVTGVVDPKSLVTKITNSHPGGFDFSLTINLSKVIISTPSLSLCEDRLPKIKKCGGGIKATVKTLKVATLNRPISISSTMRLTNKEGVATVKVLNVNSNLDTKSSPSIDINFESLEIPRIAIVINGQETELDTSRLKEKVLEKKQFLGKKLLSFAGDFIAHDLAEMLNIYLVNSPVSTTIQVYQRQQEATYNERTFKDPYVAPRDHTYVKPQIVIARDNTYVKPPVVMAYEPKPATDVMKVLMEQFARVVRHAQVDLSLKTIKTPLNKDIELTGVLNFVLNHTTFRVKNTLGNSARVLPSLDLGEFRQNDVNLAISEPLLNGALDLVQSTGLFNDLLAEISDEDSLSVNSLKLHFTNGGSLKAVVNVSVDLKKVRTSFWKDPKGWAETGIGVWLERNNNNSVIYFPIEIEVIPVVARDPATGGVSLSIKVNSAFKGDQLLNSYGYPSNVGNMFNIVRQGVMTKLHSQLDQYAGKKFEIDLDKFLNQSGVVFLPKSIVFHKAAYMLVNLDIKDIKFDSKKPMRTK